MGAAHPVRWAAGKRDKLDELARHLELFARCRDVCLPGVPLAAPFGFCLNGDRWNTTGWKVGDQAERDEYSAKGRFPFKNRDPRDRSVYGAVTRTGDLHEIWWFGTEAGKTPTATATDPRCPAVYLADDPEVIKAIGRAASTGARWYGDDEGNAAVGFANLRRHWHGARVDLDDRISWAADDKRATLWRWAMASMHWSAGGGGSNHANAYVDQLAAVPESKRWGAFMRLAAETDGGKSRHRDDEYSALRTAQKIEGAVLACEHIPSEPWALEWLREDGLSDVQRAAVYARLVEVSGD
jgi:hypothetical protein